MNRAIINFSNSEFEVFKDVNQEIYRRIESDSAGTISRYNDNIIRFFATNRKSLLTKELVDFMKLTCIDWAKDNEVYHYPVDNLIVIEGWYDIAGKIINKEKVGSIALNTRFGTTNIFIENNPDHGVMVDLKNFQLFRVNFAIVIEKEVVIENTHNITSQ